MPEMDEDGKDKVEDTPISDDSEKKEQEQLLKSVEPEDRPMETEEIEIGGSKDISKETQDDMAALPSSLKKQLVRKNSNQRSKKKKMMRKRRLPMR